MFPSTPCAPSMFPSVSLFCSGCLVANIASHRPPAAEVGIVRPVSCRSAFLSGVESIFTGAAPLLDYGMLPCSRSPPLQPSIWRWHALGIVLRQEEYWVNSQNNRRGGCMFLSRCALVWQLVHRSFPLTFHACKFKPALTRSPVCHLCCTW